MIEITFVDDRTGTDESSNYRYQVAIRHIIVAQGRIEGHDPADGWRALVREMVAPGMLEACKSGLRWLEWGQYQGGGEDEWLKKCLREAVAAAKGTDANSTAETDPPERPCCQHNIPRKLSYHGDQRDARRRLARGEMQILCHVCERWVWEEYWLEGDLDLVGGV